MDEPALQLDQRADGRDYRLALGKRMEVALPENPTTGYRWQLVDDGQPSLALIDDRFDTPGGPPGRGGSRHWVFKAVRLGRAEIRAVYRRAWKAENAQSRRFRTAVIIVSDK
jgi:inhibitor of cysteine peptidase